MDIVVDMTNWVVKCRVTKNDVGWVAEGIEVIENWMNINKILCIIKKLKYDYDTNIFSYYF